MARLDFPFVKYVFLSVLFVLSFISLYTEKLEVYGFGSAFILETLLAIMVFMDIIQNPLDRAKNVITFPSFPNPVAPVPSLTIPFFWTLIIAVSLQFVSATMMMISMTSIYKRYNDMRLSRDNRSRVNTYKWMFLVSFILLFIMIYGYIQYGNGLSNSFQTILLLCITGTFLLGSLEIIYANQLSKVLGTMVD